MFTRTLTYNRVNTSTEFVLQGGNSTDLATHTSILNARSTATGFQGETTTTSADNLSISYVSTWASAADYNAFYTANKANIDAWVAYKNQYNALNFIGMIDKHVGQ